ncbi:tRNA pseudouridine synthase [Ramaria rubella]|nr:tRNA pseudouridine synthase [Ramaria rubella]
MRIPRISPMASHRILSPYHNWTREDLITRLHQLESEPATKISKNKDLQPESFSFSSHPTRKIALKLCYVGSEYNGLAFQKDYTPLPTVEGVLFDALARTRLIDAEKGFEGCQWERCGRTDRGVSAAGQVISLWVRSAIWSASNHEPLEGSQTSTTMSPTESAMDEVNDDLPLINNLDPPFSSCVQNNDSNSSTSTEISYIQVLNRVLPQTVRVICWSPVSDSFSARFSCRYRHYKYFFAASADLDISRMRDGASRLVGTHDFRNLCTLDGSKQIENYNRAIHRAEISLVDPAESDMETGAMYVFDLVGTAFLYNQVRSIMAILFLVGTGLEQPHIVSSLLNVDPHNPMPPFRPGEPIHLVDRKPSYQMADGLPLVLWDCGYSAEDVLWRTGKEPSVSAVGLSTEEENPITTNLRHQMFSIYTRSRIRTTLDGHFLQLAAQYHPPPFTPFPLPSPADLAPLLQTQKTILNVPVGGGSHIRTAKYKPLLTRERGESAEVVNERWRQGRGKKRLAERIAKQGEALQVGDADE